jgi:hypothetical protein
MPSAAKSKTVTLVANTAQTVTLTGKYRRIKVVNFSATDRVSVALMGVTSTVDGDDTIPVPPASTVTVYDDTTPNAVSVTAEDTDYDVSLKSAGTPVVCVWAE